MEPTTHPTICFTGTRQGMTVEQYQTVTDLLIDLTPAALFHGDCLGADEDADRIAHDLQIRREAYPGFSNNGSSKWRAGCLADVVHPPDEYLKRNRHMAYLADLTIACPKEDHNVKRGSGTWYTARYTRRVLDKPLYLVLPDGTVLREVPT